MFIHYGVIGDIKDFEREEKEFLRFSVLVLGATLQYEIEKDKINDEYSVSDLVLVGCAPVAKAKDNKAYFESKIVGMKKEKDMKKLLEVPKGQVSVISNDLISMVINGEPVVYRSLIFSGDLNGTFTGSKDFCSELKKLTKYDCSMTLSIKNGVLQYIPSNFKEVENSTIKF